MKRIVLALSCFVMLAGAKPVDWTRLVTKTAEGAYVLGNPKAPVRLVEYLSYTCSHCAHFERDSVTPLTKDFVANGSVAVELRHAVRDRLDMAAALAARCRGAAYVFTDSQAIFAAQDALLQRADTFEQIANIGEGTSPPDAMKAVARGSGLSDLMARRGLRPAQLDACLSAKTGMDPVLAMTEEAWETRKIPGTPAFLINDRLTGGTWAQVEPQLRAELAPRTATDAKQ